MSLRKGFLSIIRKGQKKPGEEVTPLSGEFEIMATVREVIICDSLGSSNRSFPRPVAVFSLYSDKPIMANGETEHQFFLHISNNSCIPEFAKDRMRFWKCYGGKQPVELNDDDELYVPFIDSMDCKNFQGRYMKFRARIVLIATGKEAVEIDFRNNYRR